MSIRLCKIKYKSKWRPNIAQIGPVGCRQDHGSEGTTMSILEGDRHGLYPRFAPRTARLPTGGAWSHADKGCRDWSFCATIALHRQICLSCYTPTDPQTLPSLARLLSRERWSAFFGHTGDGIASASRVHGMSTDLRSYASRPQRLG